MEHTTTTIRRYALILGGIYIPLSGRDALPPLSVLTSLSLFSGWTIMCYTSSLDWRLMVCLSVLPTQIYCPSGASPGHWSQQGLCGSGLLAGRPWLQALPFALPPQGNAASQLCPALACPQRAGSGLSPETPDSSWHDQSTAGVTLCHCDWWVHFTVVIIIIILIKKVYLITFTWLFLLSLGCCAYLL